MKIYHPIGNLKISIIKNCAKFLNFLIFSILSLFLKINTKKNEIIISTALSAPWKEDETFSSFYEKIKELTLLDTKRLYTLWYLSKDLKNINANIIDIGCMQGGAGFAMSKINNKGQTLMFDTFEGFYEEEEFHKKNKHFIYEEIDEVKKNITKFNLKNTKVFKCQFPKNLSYSIKKKKFKLCHIDVNTYKSTKNAFNFIKSRMIKGGAIVFDDYGIYGADQIKVFINNISKKYQKQFTFIYNFMGQCILIKK